MSEITFSTSDIHELDIDLINILLTQAKRNDDARKEVIRACKYVLDKLGAAYEL